MNIVESKEELKSILEPLRKKNKIAFIPSMGVLHKGHESLVRAAKGAYTVLSIYVNPKQFTPEEDFEHYPRNLEKDIKTASSWNLDLIFYPKDKDIYPHNFSTEIRVASLSRKLCGKKRSKHFQGVATVVARLFGLVRPDSAYFGEKDMQQYLIIRQMVKDLELPVKIIACPTVREEDGLALSSRNQYLSKEERKKASLLYKALCLVKETYENDEREVKVLVEKGRSLLKEVELEYMEILSYPCLEEISQIERKAICALAARMGRTRLIDNIRLEKNKHSTTLPSLQ